MSTYNSPNFINGDIFRFDKNNTGCPKSKVTILIFYNFLMKKVAWMKFSWYLVMNLNFCFKMNKSVQIHILS